MPGTNAGTGQPIALRCSQCRQRRGRYFPMMPANHGFNLIATGRVRPARHRGIRQTHRRIQYRCLDCGHVGWTQHSDAERLKGVPSAEHP